MNVNLVVVAGNLTRDPEVRFTPKGHAVANLSVAVNRRWKTDDGEDKEEVTFIEIQAWGKTAEILGRHCTKGANLLFQGRLKLDQWEDKKTGDKRSKLFVVAESFQFAGKKPEGEESPARPQARKMQPARSEEQEGPPDEEDSVPF